MKKMRIWEEYNHKVREYDVIIGTDREIRSLYRRIDEHTNLVPLCGSEPEYRKYGMYGLCIDYTHKSYSIDNADTLVEMFLACMENKTLHFDN